MIEILIQKPVQFMINCWERTLFSLLLYQLRSALLFNFSFC